MTIGIVTDSNAQLPVELRDRFAVHVVPLVIVIDGREYREGIDLTAEEFYAHLQAGGTVSTAAPAPGEVLAVYEAAIDAGASEILSVHVGSNTSGTCNAVRLAAQAAMVPVDIVDTGTASFAIAGCVWAAADALADGADIGTAAAAARATASTVGNVFVVGALDLARRGGRLGSSASEVDGIPVLAFEQGEMNVVGRAVDVAGAVGAMTDYVVGEARHRHLRVGVGDARSPDVAAALADALRARSEVVELVHYAIGPSVGAHTGAGTVGACFF
ncbi:MAG: DegV family EDD domain-containing protein [Acidimicrobiia bacterium]|nr:DegV family EDD domain-containing protein [Acidimicrobiia bacterium]